MMQFTVLGTSQPACAAVTRSFGAFVRTAG